MTRRGAISCRTGGIIGFMRLLSQLPDDPFLWIVPLLLFFAVVGAGLILRRILFGALKNWSARNESQLGALVTGTLKGPVVLWTIMMALHVATQNSAIPPPFQQYIHTTLEVLWLTSLISAVSRFAGRSIRLYG